MLTAYYDLRHSPPTYDVVAFLLTAEVRRQQKPDQPLHVAFVPGPAGGFRRDRYWPTDIATREKLLRKVAVPMAEMMPTTSVEVLTSRPSRPEPNSFGLGVGMYGMKTFVDAMRHGCRPLRAPLTPKRDDRLVTITLREASHWPQRNSSLNSWLQAAIEIRDLGYDVVFVRDEVCAEAKFGDFPIAPMASRDLNQRARLYGSAGCNMFVNNGPAWFAMALDVPVLMFKPTVENHPSSTRQYFARCGVPSGGQVPGAPDYQRIVWAPDNAPDVVAGFRKFQDGRMVADCNAANDACAGTAS